MENRQDTYTNTKVSLDHFNDIENEFSLFAMYLNRNDAEKAVQALKLNDFAEEDISLLAPSASGHRDFVYQQTQSVQMGAFIGAITGFFLLGLAGIYLGSNNPEQLGMNSWIMSTVVAAVVGLVLGAACGALVGIGSTKSAGKRYGFYLKEGGIVLTVKVKNEQERLLALQLLEKNRGQDISVLPDSEIWTRVIPEKRKLDSLSKMEEFRKPINIS